MIKIYKSSENKENEILTDHEKRCRIRELRKMIVGILLNCIEVNGEGFVTIFLFIIYSK